MKVYDHICNHCKKSFKSDKNKHSVCIFCFINQMNCYDPQDYDHAVEHILDEYRMDQNFKVKCRKCGKRFETIKRGIFNFGFVCDKCRYPDEKLKSILERLKPKEFGGIE